MQETWVWSLGWGDPLEEEMATHPSILAWRIPWTEEPGGLQSIGLQRVRYNWNELACMHVKQRRKSLDRAEQFQRRGQSCLAFTMKVQHPKFQCYACKLLQVPFQKPWCSLCFTQQNMVGACLPLPSSKDGTSWNHTCTTKAEYCYWSKVTVQIFLSRVMPSGASEIGLPQVNPDCQANSPRAATDMWFQPMRITAWDALGVAMGMELVKTLGAGKPPQCIAMFLTCLGPVTPFLFSYFSVTEWWFLACIVFWKQRTSLIHRFVVG